MSSDNPYRAPSAEVADFAEGGLELAGRGHRFGAATIDGTLALLFLVPVGYSTGIYDFFGGHETSMLGNAAISALGFLFFMLTQAYFLKKSGQTIGKKIVGIRIVDLEDNLPSLSRLLFVRYGAMYLFNGLPLGGVISLVDNVLIFRSDRRCVHDLIAKTRVVLHRPKLSSVTWFVLPFLLLIAVGVGAAVVMPMIERAKYRHEEERLKLAPRTAPAPAKHAPAAPAPHPATDGARPADAATPPPAAQDTPRQEPEAPRVENAPAETQLSDAELRKCAALKDPAAIIRCSQGGK